MLEELKARIDKDEYAGVAMHREEHLHTIAETKSFTEQIRLFQTHSEGKSREQFENLISNNTGDVESTFEDLVSRSLDIAKL